MKNYIYVSLVSLLVGAFVAFKLIPAPAPKVITQVKTVVKTNTVTKYKKVKSPDGTITITVDKDKQVDSNTDAKSVPIRKDWNVALYGTSKHVYGVGVQRKIIYDLSIYTSLQTDGQVAVGIGWSF